MLRRLFSGTTSPPAYAVAAILLVLSQPLAAELAFRAAGLPVERTLEFWLLPVRNVASSSGMPAWASVPMFLWSLTVAWTLAALSFRRARDARGGYEFAAYVIVPALQVVIVPIMTLLRTNEDEAYPEEQALIGSADLDAERRWLPIIEGVLAGATLIVLAVLISAVSLGTYGWGLFVMTPLLTGLLSAYIANRRAAIRKGDTAYVVVGSAVLGAATLLALALEGLMCIVLIAPLAIILAALGGVIGKWAARAVNRVYQPLRAVAVLPLLFVVEATIPPEAGISLARSIEIDAPPAVVWEALVANRKVAASPGLIGLAGLAYPVESRLDGEGIGAIRKGVFSTGTARELVTTWEPGRRLAVRVLEQPPAMEEMSPYRHVHAPHLVGYFDTETMLFDITVAENGRTRLTLVAEHVLRIDPVPYWAPIAKWAIGENVDRVLQDLRLEAEKPHT